MPDPAVHTMGRRIAAINDTIAQIMKGDLARRMPTDESGDDFDQLAGNLNRMLDRISSLMDGVRQVSDNIAHDLRTPLARLRNRLEELRLDTDSGRGGADTTRQAVEDALAEADGLLATFGALLRIARIEADARRENFAPVDLGELVGDVVELYEPLAEEKGQQLSVTVEPVSVLEGDRDLLFQALANIVDNAIKYAPGSGHIGVALTAAEHGPRIEVADDGPGIPGDAKAKAFERFWRLDDSRSSPGSGLGLSLAAAVARLHNAEVQLEDNDPGLRVRLSFGF